MLPRWSLPKNRSVGLTPFQVLVCFFASTLMAPAIDLPLFSESRQVPYPYSVNIAYFDTAPSVHFTVKDFTRTNKNLAEKYGDESSNGKTPAVIHLSVCVVPVLSDDQYRIQIVSDHSLSKAKLNEIEEFIGENMLARL